MHYTYNMYMHYKQLNTYYASLFDVCFSLSSLDVLKLIRQRKKGSAFVKVEMIMVKTTLIKWSFVGYECSKRGYINYLSLAWSVGKLGKSKQKTEAHTTNFAKCKSGFCKNTRTNCFRSNHNAFKCVTGDRDDMCA